MRFHARALQLITLLRRDVRRAGLTRAVAEVFASVVEGAAGFHLDLHARQRNRTVAAIDDADGELAAGDERLDHVGNLESHVEAMIAIDEVQSAARTARDRLEHELLV